MSLIPSRGIIIDLTMLKKFCRSK